MAAIVGTAAEAATATEAIAEEAEVMVDPDAAMAAVDTETGVAEAAVEEAMAADAATVARAADTAATSTVSSGLLAHHFLIYYTSYFSLLMLVIALESELRFRDLCFSISRVAIGSPLGRA